MWGRRGISDGSFGRSMKPDPSQWGVLTEYRDFRKQTHVAPGETVEAILATMGAGAERPVSGVSVPLVITEGGSTPVQGEWTVELEDGGHRHGSRLLPRDLPLGYHRLCTSDGERMLIVAPAAAKSLDGVREWGWAVQLYAMRSKRSWGIGDLGDLDAFVSLAEKGGAGFVLLNPLHAAIPGEAQQASPYYPSSREFRNPLYINIAAVPGWESLSGELRASGEALNSNQLIDRDAVFEIKMKALSELWARFAPDSTAFTAYRKAQGVGLIRYATYCALREEFGMLWRQWPVMYRHPANDSVQEYAHEHHDRVLFHQWLQYLLDAQLSKAGNRVGLFNDLAIGVDPAGADAWLWQDAYALDMRVGAPPDEFNQKGQDWGLPPFDPWKLQQLNYEPFIRTIRAGLAHAGGIRIDHVMGLFRLYWIPEGASAKDGTYVQYPYEDLLSIVCLESVRAGAYVVGEDLGTVEPYMRDELAARNIASYRLLWFEEDPPPVYPSKSMAAVTTHDLPTVAGLWSGRDLQRQKDLGTDPNVEATEAMKYRVAEMAEVSSDAEASTATDACHTLLARAASALVSVTLEDALRLDARPNYPGTTSEYPNWSVALPVLLDDFEETPGFLATQRVVSSTRVIR